MDWRLVYGIYIYIEGNESYGKEWIILESVKWEKKRGCGKVFWEILIFKEWFEEEKFIKEV